MAKLSARGATVLAKWTDTEGKGAELALTSDGRLLYKWRKGEGWNLVGRKYDLERASTYAKLRGYARGAR